MSDAQQIDQLQKRITRLEHRLARLTAGITTGTGGTGVTDHGVLTGLGDDDHAQYHNDGRAATWLGTKDSDDLAEGATNLYFSAAEASKLAGIETGADVTDAANIAAAIHAATLDATPLDADEVPGLDSSASFALVRWTWTSIKAFLKAYFDTLYNLYVHPNHSGEVTSVGDGATTIAVDAVTYAKMQNVSVSDRVLGRSTAGAGDVEEIAMTAAGRALVDDADATAQRATLGLGTIAVETATNYLRRSGVDTLSANWDIGDTRKLITDFIRARDAAGLILQDDAGNPGVYVEDGGNLVTIAAASHVEPYTGFDGQGNPTVVVRYATAHSASWPFVGFLFSNNLTDATNGGLAQLTAMNEAIAAAEKRLAQILFMTDAATDDGQIRLRVFNSGTLNDVLTIRSNGYVGLQNTTPQGPLHIHDGTGGSLFTTKTGINATPQTIIPNGTGDVTVCLVGDFIVKDSVGSSTFGSLNGISPGGTQVFTTTAGHAVTLTVAADGSVSIARSSGDRTFTALFELHWL